ncbi:MAG TPA: type I methionyl aminopeptidase [Clostridiales bacterium]|nr:type I methionyl aminopeptidase [Clostridiales bacterium]
MITIKTQNEIDKMRKAGLIVRDVLNIMGDNIKVGITTKELDKIAYEHIISCGAYPSFFGYRGYPASICVSIDDEVVHGIPSPKRILEEGQIVSIDVGAYINGYHADAARTFEVGQVSAQNKKLIKVTEQSFFEGLKVLKDGVRLGDLSSAIQNYVEKAGFSVVRALVGHGIGKQIHEDPSVPNFGTAGKGVRLAQNMTIAIEPMVNMGGHEVEFCPDGWTVKTKDGLPSAHYENTVVITSDGAEILTL